MLNYIEDKENRMNIKITSLFNSMTDSDFMMLHKHGQLKTFCDALSVDLQPKTNEKDYPYTA